MMKITYDYTTRMTIILDDEFLIEYGAGSLDNGVNKARWAMGEYGFTCAIITDSDTGEVLATLEND